MPPPFRELIAWFQGKIKKKKKEVKKGKNSAALPGFLPGFMLVSKAEKKSNMGKYYPSVKIWGVFMDK